MIIVNEQGMPQLNTVHHCDALKLLGNMVSKSVDAIITDPPYGFAGRVFDVDGSSRGEDSHKGNYSAVNESWDRIAPTDWMAECTRVLKPGGSVICFGVRQSVYVFASEGLRLGWRIINDVTCEKPDPPPNFTGRMMTESTERFLWFCPTGTGWTYNLSEAKSRGGGVNLRDVWRFRTPHHNRLHPTEKPLDVMEKIISLITNQGDLVVDPFSGSGTTGRAAINLGRRFMGCDITFKYAQLACNRLALPYTPGFMHLLEDS